MKKMLTLILAAALCLSMAACGSEPDDTSEPDSESSSSSQDVGEEESEDASLEVIEGEGNEPEEDENVSKLDTEESASEPEASQEAESSSQASAPSSTAGGQSSGQSVSSQAPASQPEEQPDEQPVEEVEPEEEPVSQEPTQPVTQPSSQSEVPAASSQDDPTAWTQEKVDAVVEAYRQAALDRGWEEAPELNINGNGAWGNPWDTRNTRYDVLTKASNIEEFLYGLEFDIDRSPEEMSFNIYVEDEGDYWVIYFIFAGDMK